MDIEEAGRQLGSKLCNIVRHVIDTNVWWGTDGVQHLFVYVDVMSLHDVHEVIHKILKEIGDVQFEGHVICLDLPKNLEFYAL